MKNTETELKQWASQAITKSTIKSKLEYSTIRKVLNAFNLSFRVTHEEEVATITILCTDAD